MIKEVIFDIDGTLYNYEKGHKVGLQHMKDYAEQELGIPGEKFEQEYHGQLTEIKKRLGTDNATIHSRSIRIQNMLEAWDKPIFPHLDRLYHLYWDSFIVECQAEPGSIEALRSLQRMGIRIGIGTDMTAGIQYKKLEAFGFGPFINHIVTSQEAGHEKPHPCFMELCVQKAGCRPDEIAFMGDNFKKDVEGAVMAGMHGIWYCPVKKPDPEDARLDAKEYGVIRQYDELVPYIKSIR